MESSAPQNLGSQVELYISCRKLKDLDVMSKSDPKVIVYMKQGNSGDFQVVGQTEVIKNNLSPDFKTSIPLFYKFEVHQNLKFEVVDYDSDEKFEVIGSAETSLGNIVGGGNFQYEGNLHCQGKKASSGQIMVRVQTLNKASTSKELLHLKISAKGSLPHSSCCSSVCAPQLEILKAVKSGEQTNYYNVYTSEKQNNQNPSFRPMKLSMARLCNSDQDAPIQLKFSNIVHREQKLIGVVDTTVNQIMELKEADIINPLLKNQSAKMIVDEFKFMEAPTSFLEYLQCGWQINMTVAIDYTGSNGTPSEPTSLHYLGGNNQYQQAIKSVGSILEVYDSDKMFPVLGFGGIPKGFSDTRNCFSVNGGDNPEVKGIEGILQIYKEKMSSIQLSGPTVFAPLLKRHAYLVKQKEQQPAYSILLLLTDGIIDDMNETKSAIIEASTLPMSIIIIGVGNADFAQMRELDSDETILRDNSGKTAVRDIVQFVDYKAFSTEGPEYLASEVLKEIPDQFIKYMQYKGQQV